MNTRQEPNGPTDPPPTSGALPSSKYKRSKNTSKTPNEIVIDPDRLSKTASNGTIKEETESTAVFAFGRFNPPTVGHEKLIQKVESVAREHGGKAHIVASHTENKSKDPLPQDKKVGYLKKVASPSTDVSGSSRTEPTFLHAAKRLHQAGHKHLVMVAGSDRVDEYKEKLEKYNGHPDHYNFKSIKVVSAGARDPDAEGVEGMSGTKIREHARAGRMKEFKSGLPKVLHPHAREISNHVRSISEETIIEGAVLGVKQRMMRGIQAKKNKSKLALARKLARERMAKSPALKRRAQKIARKLLRVRVAGKRANAYNNLSVADKMALDRLVKDKSKIISSIAKKIVPRVRSREVQRLAGVAPGQRTKVPMMMSFEPIDVVARPDTKKDDKNKLRRNTEYYRKIIEDCGLEEDFIDSIMHKILLEKQDPVRPTLRGMRNAMSKIKKNVLEIPIVQQQPSQKKSQSIPIPTSVVEVAEKDLKALKEKSDVSGISMDVLRQVFQRGMKAKPANLTAQQSGFARIASFLNKGKSYTKEDADLAEAVEKVKKQDPNSANRLDGTKSLADIYRKETPGQVKEDLRDWFKDKWVRMDTKGNIKGDCARKEGEGKPKCLPIAKARAMTKKDRATAVNRKRREDPVADREGKGNKPVNVATEETKTSELIKKSQSKRGAPGTLKAKIDGDITLSKVRALKNKPDATTLDKKQANFYINMHSEEVEDLQEKNKPTNPKLWSQAVSLARSKFDVYPSAYANGWAARWYKSKGGGWKSVSEETSRQGPCWDGYRMAGFKTKNNKKVPNCVPEERLSFSQYNEATFQGKKVPLNKPMAGDVKKSKVFVDLDGDGVAKKVNFGDPNMSIKKNIPARRKSFRARHSCDEPGPKDKPRYWSCKAWK